MEPINLTATTNWEFIEQVRKESHQDPAQCYQCGNCSAGCPYTRYFDIPVSQVMRLLQVGQKDTILKSKSIWLCATCETCTTRCPCEIDVAHVMDVLRIIARRENYVSEKDVKKFFDAFLDSLKRHGRVFEVGILMGYNFKSGHLFSDADLGPKIMGKGKVHFLPPQIKGKDKVARIFSKFEETRRSRG